MRRPENCIYIIQGELNLLVTALRRSHRWLTHNHQDDDQDPLVSSFSQLKDLLNTVTDLSEVSPNEVLGPFLEVIRSEETTGPITGMALGSINKFLSYGFIDPSCDMATAAIENVADAVTHARFVGTDPNSDEVVLMKILHVLRTMLLTEAGVLLTNESVCEIMQSCFRICFEMRLSELLRKSAEHTLMDMVQVLFSRLPHFKEDPKWLINMKKLKMRASGMDPTHNNKYKKRSPKPKPKKIQGGSGGGATGHGTLHPMARSDSPSQCATPPPGEHEKCGASEQVSRVAPPDADTPLAGAISDVEATLERSEVIATTPVTGTKTVVDIQTSFQRACEDGDNLHDSITDTSGQPVLGLDMGGQPVLGPDTSGQPSIQPGTSAQLVVGPETSGQSSLESDTQDTVQSGTPQVIDDVTGDTNQGYVAGMDTCPVTLATDRTEGISCTVQTTSDTKTGDTETPTDGVEGDTPREASAPPPNRSSGHEVDYVNPRGVRFTSHHRGSGPLVPYGLPCVRELFRFLMSLTNPLDRQNTDVMVHMGLSLLTVALEAGADHISKFNSLLYLIKDDMCKNLFFLLQSDRLSLFAAAIRVCFLLFECMRSHLKFQLEMYLNKLIDIIVSDSPRISYEQREIALDSIVQLLRIPGLVTELYLNYDCDLYSSSLFEDLMKLLSKNAFPVSGLFTTHLLSLDALLAVIDSIEQHCQHVMLHSSSTATDHSRLSASPNTASLDGKMSRADERMERNSPTPPPVLGLTGNKAGITTDLEGNKTKGKEARSGPKVRPNRMKVSSEIPSAEVLTAIKQKKKVYHMGTELFNQKPSKGITYLQEHGLLVTPLDPSEVVVFIKENHKLDKKQIGEFVSRRKNEPILVAFLKSFNFEDTRVDESLRMLLESFRLPGEAPVISYILEHFADHWHKMTGETFVNADAAFTLAYAVIMLNVDQHNTNAKKQNVPMTSKEFKKNVKGVNGGGDFDQDMLEEIYNAIKADEIVMPAEQTGLVKENYLWKMLLRRGATNEGNFLHVATGMFDHDLFALVWGPTVAALSFVFDKSSDEAIIQKAVSGFRKCAMISAHYGMSDVFDNLVISLCKFTTLLSSAESADMIPVQFGNNSKAQLSARTVFGLAHRHGDILRDGWKNILDCILQLYRAKLLPDLLVKVEDFVDPNGKISLIREETPAQRNDTGVLSSFYSYFTLAESMPQRGPAPEEQDAIHRAQSCILDCHIDQLITETKFLRADSLAELLKALLVASRCPEVQETMNGTLCDEDSVVFFLELLIRVVLQNRDRIGPFWQSIRDHIYNIVVNNASTNSFLVERAIVGLLRLAIRLLRRDDLAPQVRGHLVVRKFF
ncbi:Golgi-specific brefeldin A-resistance guanine nucleotide exchange factor 1 [Lamellibrachia satsuma]|nr:Golgi-specific brefeldin A-resistance guanine nucleotide exchange factor 1 [Lamellibrachia satsuma]